ALAGSAHPVLDRDGGGGDSRCGSALRIYRALEFCAERFPFLAACSACALLARIPRVPGSRRHAFRIRNHPAGGDRGIRREPLPAGRSVGPARGERRADPVAGAGPAGRPPRPPPPATPPPAPHRAPRPSPPPVLPPPRPPIRAR